MTSVRQLLRTATRSDHEAVDDAFSELDLTRAADLAVFLGAHLTALRELEPFFEGLLPETPWPSRVPLLLADLEALGAPTVDDRGAGSPRLLSETASADLESRSARLGAAYVVAGSHLGLRVLRRTWAESEDERVLAADRFLQDESVAGYWQALLPRLEECGNDAQRLAAVSGARLAFSRFAEGLAQERTTAGCNMDIENCETGQSMGEGRLS